MKKVLFFLVGILFTISSYSQQSINTQIGYSRSMGLIGFDYQFNNFAVGAGYLPVSLQYSDKYYHSFSANLTWCDYTYNRSGYYLSVAFASAGYYPTYVGKCDDPKNKLAPMGLINVGYKMYFGEGFNLKTEIGYGISEIENLVVFGITFGYTIKITD